MVSEDWTDKVCRAVQVLRVGIANRVVSVNSLSTSHPRRYLIRKGECVGLTEYFSNIGGRVVDKEADAQRVDIMFLEGHQIINASAPKDAFDELRRVEQ
jgi:hypothetical protein